MEASPPPTSIPRPPKSGFTLTMLSEHFLQLYYYYFLSWGTELVS